MVLHKAAAMPSDILGVAGSMAEGEAFGASNGGKRRFGAGYGVEAVGAGRRTHAQKCERLQAARARVVAERRLRDAVEGVVVVPLQRILTRQRHLRRRSRLHNLV